MCILWSNYLENTLCEMVEMVQDVLQLYFITLVQFFIFSYQITNFFIIAHI